MVLHVSLAHHDQQLALDILQDLQVLQHLHYYICKRKQENNKSKNIKVKYGLQKWLHYSYDIQGGYTCQGDQDSHLINA